MIRKLDEENTDLCISGSFFFGRLCDCDFIRLKLRHLQHLRNWLWLSLTNRPREPGLK